MSIQPKSKFQDLLDILTSFSKDKVLSDFERTRFLGQTKALMNIDAARAWYIKGLIYYFSNDTDNMLSAFSNSLSLDSRDFQVVENFIACSMNHGLLNEALKIFSVYSSYFIEYKKDYDLILKLNKLALNLYAFDQLENIKDLLNSHTLDSELDEILHSTSIEFEKTQQMLNALGVKWEDANKIALLALKTLKEAKARPNSIVEIRELDDEVYNVMYIHTDSEKIGIINDMLFDKVYEQNLLNAWNKVMFMFLAENKQETLKEVG